MTEFIYSDPVTKGNFLYLEQCIIGNQSIQKLTLTQAYLTDEAMMSMKEGIL